jgi:hypothetical protein
VKAFPAYPNYTTMLNYKIERNTDNFLEKAGGSYTYSYKGKDYEITQESLKSMDPGLQQSFGHFTAKKKGKSPTPSYIPKMTLQKGDNYLPPSVKAAGISKVMEVRRELLRLARTEVIVEDKLDMPKVFKALLTEPHTALDYRKKTVEEEINLTLIVDTNVRYHINGHMQEVDRLFHNTLIEAAHGVKGIHVFYAEALHGLHHKGHRYDYYTDLYKDLPTKLKRKVFVFTQGCGHVGHYLEMPKKAVHFCTGFAHHHNCGCPQIEKAAISGQVMHYGVTNVSKLKQITL